MTAPTTTCPDWCIAPRDDEHTFHYQLATRIPSTNIGDLTVSVSFNERTGQASIEVGEHEFTPEQAGQLWNALAAATDIAVAVQRLQR